jgi:hypothetical protein
MSELQLDRLIISTDKKTLAEVPGTVHFYCGGTTTTINRSEASTLISFLKQELKLYETK